MHANGWHFFRHFLRDARPAFTPEQTDRYIQAWSQPGAATAMIDYYRSSVRSGSARNARERPRAAYGMLEAISMEAFAERDRRELIATGETVRKRTAETSDQLTAQETLIARLARDGLSNPEIAAQLFLSARTVEWHLRKVFTNSASAPDGNYRWP